MNDIAQWGTFLGEYSRLVAQINLTGICIKTIIHLINMYEVRGPVDRLIAQVRFYESIRYPRQSGSSDSSRRNMNGKESNF